MQTKKYLHIVKYDKFTNGFIQGINEEFNKNEHFFIVVEPKKKWDIELCDNLKIVKSRRDLIFNKEIRRSILECEKLFINGAFGNEICLWFYPSKVLKKKTFILFWGGDFYPLDNPPNLFCKFIYANKRHLIRNAYAVMNLIQDDYLKLIQKVKRIRGKSFVAPMLGSKRNTELRASISFREKSNNPYFILVGNSATESNQHREVFDLLKQYKDENIKVLCPLSYGIPKYRDEIVAYGQMCLGDKFVPILDYMEFSEYLKLLANCTVVVMNHNRQQAMGNISNAIYFGAKVYIREDTSMWSEYTNERSLEVYNVESIKSMNYEEFLYIDDIIKEQNRENSNADKRRECIIQQWKTVFEE